MSPLIKIDNETFVRKSEILALCVNFEGTTTICMKHEVQILIKNKTPEQVQKILEGKEETTNETSD